ncbi:restriction endonuclease subunit S [Thiothrix nivea]|uniref:Restriction modification system DNA specificity domain-containing protein n=1 Tax=Thiothrix nivea (strain ATCC 35100 / DSM 5205 / JP2) TaxID=870187 RepID=A0A656HGB7_THINJ|nr:restriction endonuclease subunit S [Thiothrix nivea]EIJ34430.1 restriction modification system DNA specificity domain-containing protein [Thiothrix nivea DSM 5205]
MERYEQYKDSGIEWIGEIPAEWGMASLKWKSTIFSGGTPDKNRPEYWYNGNIPWLNSGSVNQSIITEPSAFITEDGFKNSSAKWIEKNSVVMALAGQGKTKGMSALVTFRTTCNQSLSVIQPKPDINAKFLLYYLQSNYLHIRALAGEGKRDGLNLEMVGGISIPLLSEIEQTAIAEYLDIKTVEIDALISQKERLLELYEEEKAAIINHAVTRGIDPDVELVDSGVEWLGEIPKGWEVKKLKYTVLVNPVKDNIDKASSDEVVFLSMDKVSEDGRIDCSIKKPIVELFSGFTFFRKNDVIVAKITPCFENGKGALLDSLETDIGFGSTEFHVLRPSAVINGKFLYYITKSEVFMKVGEAFMTGAAGQKRVPTDFISDFPLVSLDLNEQIAIVKYIEAEVARLDRKISKTRRIIELQKEYRTALISEVVTGKVKVPDLESKEVAQ